jgi:hypothetical protein
VEYLREGVGSKWGWRMDENVVRVFIALIGLIATLVSHTATKETYTQRIDELSGTAARYEERARVAKSELADLEPELASLKGQYEVLEEKYERCTTVDGRVVGPASLSAAWHEDRLKTGEQWELKLSGSSAFLQLVRVTRDGAVLRVEGCEHVVVLDEMLSPDDGRNSYVLTAVADLVLWVSTDCCRTGFARCGTSDLEEVTVRLTEQDVEAQYVKLKIRKTLQSTTGG